MNQLPVWSADPNEDKQLPVDPDIRFESDFNPNPLPIAALNSFAATDPDLPNDLIEYIRLANRSSSEQQKRKFRRDLDTSAYKLMQIGKFCFVNNLTRHQTRCLG
jgi:hypothetical protein